VSEEVAEMETKERILIIEDREEVISFLTDAILHPEGYETLTAQDGQEGIRQAVEEQPDLILLNLDLPGVSGMDVLYAVHEMDSPISVALIVLDGPNEVTVEAFRLGVKSCIVDLTKPQQVLEAIENALRETRLRRAKRLLTEELMSTNRRLDQRVQELAVLYGITQAMTSVPELQTLLSRVVDASVFLTTAEEGMLFLMDEETGELYLRAARGAGETRTRVLLVPAADSLIAQVVRTGGPLRIGSPDARLGFSVKTGYVVNSLLYVPLKLREEVKGVLGVSNRVSTRAFTRIDQRRLALLADHAVIALENARLYGSMDGRASDTMKETLASMSRYAYEPLKAFATNTYALKAGIRRGDISCTDDSLHRLLSSMERRIEQMASLTEILDKLASPESTVEDWTRAKEKFQKLEAE
jgi:two-component system NtrC family sensor kinase